MSNVITDSIKADLETWRDAFVKRWGMQPPEFFLMGGVRNKDHYTSNIGAIVNPLHTEWFQQLVRSATLADLEAIEHSLSYGEISYTLYLAYRRFFQQELIKAAKKEHDERRPYSEEIPAWFRFKDWNIGSKWKCEERRDKEMWESIARIEAARATVAIRREDAPRGAAAGGAGTSAADKDLTWQLEYTALREKLKVAREAVRAAEEALDAHMDRKP